MGSDPSPALDFRLILEVPLRLFAPWLTMVLLATWAGYPGAICVTPLGWLTALAVGLRCVQRSSSSRRSQRLLEAALAGAVMGALQGVLFIIIAPRLGPLAADEQVTALSISIGMLIVGIIVAAGLSTITAWITLRRIDTNTIKSV